MKIDGTSLTPIGSVQAANRLRQVDKKQVEMGKDGVAVSSKAQTYQVLLQKVKELPEVRNERVRSIAEQIAKGEFKVDSTKIAERLIEKGCLFD
ncbi:MAG: flagellar biosynthesis anti-sigma factor FlgM [Desulfitobacterium hafniense]|nr:flagellar biosynthesis anti-sigma factor FlgM [Desulfitobacterium hafniense]